MTILIEPGNPRDFAVTALLRASHELMKELFAADANHYLSIDALCGPDIRLFVARADSHILACGALAVRDGYGEIKSIFTAPAARGQGLAAKILERLESEARTLNLSCLRLETGDLLCGALRLYTRHGFKPRAAFGDYEDDPRSLFMEKRL